MLRPCFRRSTMSDCLGVRSAFVARWVVGPPVMRTWLRRRYSASCDGFGVGDRQSCKDGAPDLHGPCCGLSPPWSAFPVARRRRASVPLVLESDGRPRGTVRGVWIWRAAKRKTTISDDLSRLRRGFVPDFGSTSGEHRGVSPTLAHACPSVRPAANTRGGYPHSGKSA